MRESQAAAFVNEGRIADIFGPGLFTLNTRTLPILTDLMNWDKEFKSPFKSDVYFFSTRIKTDQRWGTRHAHHHPRQGIRSRAHTRLWHLLLAHR